MAGFYREVKLGAVTVVIDLKSLPVFETEESFFFGYPLGKNLNSVSSDNIGTSLNSIRGYFLFLSIKHDRIIIANDICGGFRLYHCQIDNKIYLSDRYLILLRLLGSSKPLKRNDNEYHLWERQRYTSGERTFVEGLNKLAPASLGLINSDGFSHSIYFDDICNQPDVKQHLSTSYDELIEGFQLLKEDLTQKLLFFSGGMDSTLLALLMKKMGVEFHSIFLLAKPFYRDNYSDYLHAKAVADLLKIKLIVEEVDIQKGLDESNQIVERMLFDRHYSLLHFVGAEQLVKRFGTTSIFISGQTADSILSFGPSAKTKGDLAARVLMRWPGSPMARLAAMAVIRKHGRKFRIPQGEAEFLSAFFDPHEYYAMENIDTPDSVRDYFQKMVQPLTDKLHNKLSLMMYLKLYGFIQSSDNQVVIQSARKAGVNKVFLPFATPGFIYATVRYLNPNKDVISPKYVISKLLKQFGYSPPVTNYNTEGVDFHSEEIIKEKIQERYFKASSEIFNQTEMELTERM
ncbi:MAG: hypothetical protein DRP47_03650 [Candidatus Zixiibacteriota bacterium]|nr:MAG: hypothetical protein DRP47_03650 [candidate division Zixibacteria bacterium]